MRVLFLQQQPCMRSLKYAVGLRSAGVPVELGFAYVGRTLAEWYGTGDELFDHWWRVRAEPQTDLAGVVAEFGPDVVHSHNLPDQLTVLALEVANGAVPVVHDTHDLQSLRHTPYEDGFPEPAGALGLERAAVEGCTALVAVSSEMLAEIGARHRLPQCTAVFANYAVGRDLPPVLPPPERAPQRPPRVVYQGTLSTNAGHYDLREIFTRLVVEGVHLDVYPARPAPEYAELAAAWPGMTCHEQVAPQRLLELLPAYDFGWAGFNSSLNRAHLDTALPNKVFEYLGCGLPVLTLDHRAMAGLVDGEGVGASLKTLDRLTVQLEELDMVALRRRVASARHRFTVEANAERVVALYREVIGR
ncbi:MAG: glycosyltransferase [Actinobacteria bacterium]|nr:glycosyltransferase [Actinomycetota bacterium]